jgi:hypothetical protein
MSKFVKLSDGAMVFVLDGFVGQRYTSWTLFDGNNMTETHDCKITKILIDNCESISTILQSYLVNTRRRNQRKRAIHAHNKQMVLRPKGTLETSPFVTRWCKCLKGAILYVKFNQILLRIIGRSGWVSSGVYEGAR